MTGSVPVLLLLKMRAETSQDVCGVVAAMDVLGRRQSVGVRWVVENRADVTLFSAVVVGVCFFEDASSHQVSAS